MCIQEREEIDYQMGMATEYQNAFTLSQLERKPDDWTKIKQLADQGFAVVYHEVEDCCPMTDAFLGMSRFYLSHWSTKEEAFANCGEGDMIEYLSPKDIVEVEKSELPF